MQYIKASICLLFLTIGTLYSLEVLGKSVLPKLKTKQSILNIRYLSNDGKTTYFQNGSGEFFHSKNFKNKKLLSLKKRSHFLTFVSQTKKRIAVEVDQSFHDNLNFNKLNDIYVGEFDGKELYNLGKGISPKLHLQDKWLSFFNPINKEITFTNLENPKEKVNLVLMNKVNPYFRPITAVVGELLLYSDINKKGYSAIMSYNRVTKQFAPILKTKAPGMKVEICFLNNVMVIGEFSLYDLNRGGSISVIDTFSDPKLAAPQIVYSSSLSDIGNLRCQMSEKKVFFIKSLQEDLRINYRISEVVSLDIGTGAVKLRSDLKKVTQILKLDDRLLIPMRGDFYVVSGQSGLENTNFLNNKDFKLIKDNTDLNDFTRLKKLKKRKKRRRRKRRKRRKSRRRKKKKKKKEGETKKK
jgi:hypothetical protein